MFLWPDGDVTGSIHWATLEIIVRDRADKTVTKAGWDRLETLVNEHAQAVFPPAPDKPAAEAADESEPDPDPVLEDEPVEPVRRGRRAARPEKGE